MLADRASPSAHSAPTRAGKRLMFLLTPPNTFAISITLSRHSFERPDRHNPCIFIFKEKELLIVAAKTAAGALVSLYLINTYSALRHHELFRIAIYTSFYVFGCALFSIFWVSTSGMIQKRSPPDTNTGMQIPASARPARDRTSPPALHPSLACSEAHSSDSCRHSQTYHLRWSAYSPALDSDDNIPAL